MRGLAPKVWFFLGPRLRGEAIEPLTWLAIALGVLAILPLASLCLLALRPEPEMWSHLWHYVLPPALRDTVLLVLGVGILTALIGTVYASLVSLTDFPGRRVASALAVLPLAFPIYLMAFIYVELLDAAGPVQMGLTEAFGAKPAFPEIRSTGGAIVIFSLVLYPYVYLPLRLALASQPSSCREAARTLGCSPWAAFWRVQLPIARPSLVAGLMLALMEALADFGASEYLGVRTLAYTIYTTWLTRGSLSAAAQIALVLIAAVAILLAIEMRSRRRFSQRVRSERVPPVPRVRLTGLRAAGAMIFVFGIIVAAFFVPAGYLLAHAAAAAGVEGAPAALAGALGTSLALAAAGAMTVLAAAFVIALFQRRSRAPVLSQAAHAATLGYAIPGVVLALGLLFFAGAFDNAVDGLARQAFGISTGLIVSGTPLILLLAYLSRFLAVAHGPVQAQLQSLPTGLDHVARTLGRGQFGVMREVLLPRLMPVFATAWLLLAIDILKELPMTLLLRPIGIETLATSLYGNASRGAFEDGSLEALAILVSGLAAVAALQWLMHRDTARLAPRFLSTAS